MRRKEIRLRHFENLPGQKHILAKDRYLYASEKPAFNIAVIGCGTIGQEHVHVTHLLGRARVHGLYDSQPESISIAQNALHQLGTTAIEYESLDQASNDPDVDAFIIATPNHTHLDVLRQIVVSGKPILIEKPMATTLADAASIVELCQGYPAHVQVGLQYRFKAIYAEVARELFERRSIGSAKTLQLFEHRPPFLDKVNQWNKFSRNTGGTLIEKCCHYFDLLTQYADAAPVSVFANGSQAVNFHDFEYEGEQSDIMDNASVLINYENGVRANFELNMFSPNFHEELIVCGDQGRLTAKETFNVFQTQQSHSSVQVELSESGASRSTDLAYPSFIEQSGHHGATYFEHVEFVNALEGLSHSSADILQGFWSIAVGAAAEESSKTGQVVVINDFLKAHGLERYKHEKSTLK